MADATTVRYIYPPNFQTLPNWPQHEVLGFDGHQQQGFQRYILHLTNISDGTGESAAVKMTLGDHRGPSGKLVRRTVIEWIEYDIFGMDVSLFWVREPANVLLARLPGGSHVISGKIRGPLYDPGTGDGTDGSGDIVLTTVNHASGDSYDIRMSVRVKDVQKKSMNPQDVQVLRHENDAVVGIRK